MAPVGGPGPSPRRSRAGSEDGLAALRALCIVLRPRQHAGEQLGEMDALTAKVPGVDLGAAGEPVREDRGVRGCVPDRGEQPVFRTRDGYLVVAALEAEVAGQAAASGVE